MSPSCCTPIGLSLGTSLDTSLSTSLSTLLGTSLGIYTLLASFGARGGTYLNHCVSSNTRILILSCCSILKYANLSHELVQSDVELGHELGQ